MPQTLPKGLLRRLAGLLATALVAAACDGGRSATTPPVGSRIACCLNDPRDDSPVVGQLQYRSLAGDRTVSTDASGCLAVDDAEPGAPFRATAAGFEDRPAVYQTEVAGAGGRLHMVSLEEPFRTRFLVTRRAYGGEPGGIHRWRSSCLGESVPALQVKWFNLTRGQVEAIPRNLYVLEQMSGGSLTAVEVTRAETPDFEEGVVKIVGENRYDGLTSWNSVHTISAVLIRMPRGYEDERWEGLLRHELGHATGAGHTPSGSRQGLMDPISDAMTDVDALDRAAARVAYCLPVGNVTPP